MRGGIIIESLGLSQMAFELTTEMNKLDRLDEYWDIMVFYHSYDRIIKAPRFAMLQEQELWGYPAPVLATDLLTADRLLNCPRPTKKYFYVWDLEWTINPYDIDVLASVYMNEDIELVARSKEHAHIIKNCWREPIAIIEGFNYEDIIELFSRAD